MEISNFGLKELYDVRLIATSSMEMNGRSIEVGETIVLLDKIQVANFQEIKRLTSAQGGWDNRELVSWSSTQAVQFKLQQGVCSKEHFALMQNAQLIKPVNSNVHLKCRENLESDVSNIVTLTHEAADAIFVYNKSTGAKIAYTKIDNTHINIGVAFTDVIVDYDYIYTSATSYVEVGKELISGWLEFEAKARIKDDVTGNTSTVLIHIPRLKLMSGLILSLGRDTNPMVNALVAEAIPIGSRNDTQIMTMTFLSTDVDNN